MLYNLRSEILYYKSSSDFELEFNLCGCCRMRLLTDKPTNKKAFVYSLARAVSRSRIILIAGPIFGEENTIEIVAQALGTETEIVNNESYNISSDEEISIIKGSIPLVASDGAFGGCIIESGPQTMILLTDNRTLRKTLMSNLIHPYITDLYTAELKNNAATGESNDDTPGNVLLSDDGIIMDDPNEDAIQTTLKTNDDICAEELIMETEPDPEQEIRAEELVYQTEPEEYEENIAIVLPTEEELLKHDITADDIFIDVTDSNDENYQPKKDITIDDLIPTTPDFEENIDVISDKMGTIDVIIDNENKEVLNREIPKEYETIFEDLFTHDDSTIDQTPTILNSNDYKFQFFDDDGEVLGERETIFENRKPGIHVATIIVTVILLLCIAVLCYILFTASSSADMNPVEYIQNIWQTVFG